MNTRIKFENLVLKKRIKQPHEKATESLVELILKNNSLNRKEVVIIAKCLDIKKPHKLSTNSLINLFRFFSSYKNVS